jgi:NADH dehydrogenase FAD-containing subunit
VKKPSSRMADAGLVVIGGGVALLHAVQDALKLKVKVTAVCGNPFLEWNLAACHFLVRPERHLEWVSPNPEDFKLKGVDYVFDKVTEVDPSAKVVKFAGSPEISYSALIVATGSRLPLIIATPGHSLEQRMSEVKQAGEAISRAKTVVINGSGAVGLEMAGDVRARYPEKRVIILSRDGKVISFHTDAWQQKVKNQLDKMKIEVIKGSITDPSFMDPKMTPGKVVLSDSALKELEYDVFIPCFAQGPNTDFLSGAEGVINERKQIIANEFLQSTKHPEIFAVGTSTVMIKRHPVSATIAEQANTCAKNAACFLAGKPLAKHVEKGMAAMPMNIKIGHGPGGYMFWDPAALPPPAKCCCCLPCGGGYPCCPPPCCWCCCKGCSGCFGNCGKNYEGEGPATFILETGNKIFPKSHGFKGMGVAPKQNTMA